MHAILRYRKTAALTLGLLIAAVAWAATSKVQITAAVADELVPTSTGTTVATLLKVQTALLPDGWFKSGRTTDMTRTDLVTTYEFGATSCSAAIAGATVSSITSGTFQAVLTNPAGYIWSYSVDVSPQANHWHNQYLCDGTVLVVGCDQAIPVTVTTTANLQTGQGAWTCRTYVNDAGQTVCESDTATTSLPAVQDADVFDLCSDSCGIGECVSGCEHDCNPYTDKDYRKQCKLACPCYCKTRIEYPDPPVCPPHDECLN